MTHRPVETLEPGLRRVLAPNPSPMTHSGTNTYILGRGAVAVIDPGPDDPAHLTAILDALDAGETVSHILVTHSHLDHSPLARALGAQTGAPVFGYGPSQAGQSPTMARLAAQGEVGGGEGIDQSFQPDTTIADGDSIHGQGWQITAIHTPGHLSNHMCFAWGDALFSGDHVMGWASSLVSPPDGDLGAFMASCRRLGARQDRVYYPGHGDPVLDPAGRVAWLINHRQTREAQILDALQDGPASPDDLTRRIYNDTDPRLHPAARRNVLAHLIDLWERNLVEATPSLTADARFSLRRGPSK